MNNLTCDIGWKSLKRDGEQLCGDHVEIVAQEDGSQVIVLADGLGSGVKASILSTLTSKIISTMLAAGLSLEECVKTIAATLPVCSVRGIAYSTFTILHLIRNSVAEIIHYDNPDVIFLRNGKNCEYPKTEISIDGKKIFRSIIRLQDGDVFIAMSDGCPHAGVGKAYNFGWKREDIAAYMEVMNQCGFAAKNLATALADECNRLYGEKPGDDASVCVVRICKRVPMNILFGPPTNQDDADRMMRLFFAKEGKHIICGGTTARIASKWLHKPLQTSLGFMHSDLPPTACLDGVDLVTEGVITVSKVVEYARDYVGENVLYEIWITKDDGASQIARLLFEEATDINFYVGRAVNPAHQNPNLPITFHIKMNLVEALSELLRQMGKRIKVSYF